MIAAHFVQSPTTRNRPTSWPLRVVLHGAVPCPVVGSLRFCVDGLIDKRFCYCSSLLRTNHHFESSSFSFVGEHLLGARGFSKLVVPFEFAFQKIE
jgi:hypothetical protein